MNFPLSVNFLNILRFCVQFISSEVHLYVGFILFIKYRKLLKFSNIELKIFILLFDNKLLSHQKKN